MEADLLDPGAGKWTSDFNPKIVTGFPGNPFSIRFPESSYNALIVPGITVSRTQQKRRTKKLKETQQNQKKHTTLNCEFLISTKICFMNINSYRFFLVLRTNMSVRNEPLASRQVTPMNNHVQHFFVFPHQRLDHCALRSTVLVIGMKVVRNQIRLFPQRA